jgi:hypothetical protein
MLGALGSGYVLLQVPFGLKPIIQCVPVAATPRKINSVGSFCYILLGSRRWWLLFLPPIATRFILAS